MSEHLIQPWIVSLSIGKGILMSVILIPAIGLPFLEALLVAVCSATITGVFLIIATHIQAKQTRKTTEKVTEVAEKIEEKEGTNGA
jgi:hypothetical protein